MTRRLTRRTFLAGSGVAAVAAAGTAGVLATRGGSGPPPAAPRPTPSATPAQASATPNAAQRRGGRQVITSPTSLVGDTFDAQLAGASQVVEILGRTHSRLLNWDGRGDQNVIGDLARRWEMPDARTLLLHLDPAARWHDRSPLNGRALTADDVVLHFRRTLEVAARGKAPLAQRYHDFDSVDAVDSPAPGQVLFRFKAFDPYFIAALAGEFALVQAPEAVAAFSGDWKKLDSDHVVGTGPWTFDWTGGGAKFTAFRGGHREPFLDELVVTEPRNVADRFLAGELDEALVRDRRETAAIRQQFNPELFGPLGDIDDAIALASNGRTYEFHRFVREFVMSSFFIGAEPWSNPELVASLSAALGRTELADRLFGGRAAISRAVPPALANLDAVPTLEGWPGDFIDRTTGGPSSPRGRWQAAGGPGLGTITVDFPSVFDPLYSASSVVIDLLNEVLGPQFRPAVETYTTISRRVLDGYYGNGRAAFWFGWGPPISGPYVDRYIAETYAEGSAGQRLVGGPGITLEHPFSHLNSLGYLGIVPWVQQYAEVFRLPGIIADYPWPFWSQHLDYRRSNNS